MAEPTPLSQRMRRAFDRLATPVNNPWIYALIYRYLAPGDIATMNWGFGPADPALEHLHPVPGQALQLQLYWETFAQCDGALRPDQVVCEVSSGRGGGLAFVDRLTEARVIGLERDRSARGYARRRFGLEVSRTVCPEIALPDQSVDVFLSVEAVHNYRTNTFFAELHRCLKPGGQVLMSDFKIGREAAVRADMTRFLADNGLALEAWANISGNVVQSLDQDAVRHQRQLRRLPRFLRPRAEGDVAAVGSYPYEELVSGARTYFRLRARRVG